MTAAATDGRLSDEAGRIAALRRLEVLDTVPEAQFDKIVALVCTVLDVPTATVSLIDDERQWFKARRGVAEPQTPRSDSFCTHTIRQREPMIVEDASRDPRFADNAFVTAPGGVRAYAGVPLTTAEGYNVGTLCATDTVPRTFTSAQIAVLASFGNLVVDELELRQIAASDQLTGALSRRGFIAAVDKEMARCRRYARPAALALLDIDHFKRINDTLGHPAGDAVLREVVARCAGVVRPGDTIGRIGGEEFGLLLPETAPADGLAAADRLRRAIASAGFGEGAALAVTASFGIAPLTDQPTAERWIGDADAPLYAAKRAGRNRCIMAADAAREAA